MSLRRPVVRDAFQEFHNSPGEAVTAVDVQPRQEPTMPVVVLGVCGHYVAEERAVRCQTVPSAGTVSTVVLCPSCARAAGV